MTVKDYILSRIEEIEAGELEAKGCFDCEDYINGKCTSSDDCEGQEFSSNDVIQELKWVLDKVEKASKNEKIMFT